MQESPELRTLRIQYHRALTRWYTVPYDYSEAFWQVYREVEALGKKYFSAKHAAEDRAEDDQFQQWEASQQEEARASLLD